MIDSHPEPLVKPPQPQQKRQDNIHLHPPPVKCPRPFERHGLIDDVIASTIGIHTSPRNPYPPHPTPPPAGAKQSAFIYSTYLFFDSQEGASARKAQTPALQPVPRPGRSPLLMFARLLALMSPPSRWRRSCVTSP